MKIVQHPRGTTVWNAAYVGAQSQLTYDVDLNQMRVHDGATPGGRVIPTTADIAAISSVRFLAKNTKSVPATPMGAADVGDLNLFTVAGTYTLPARSLFIIGTPILLQAKIAAVIVQRAGADVINDHGVDVTSLALTLNEVVELVAYDAGAFIVTNRY